jgi:DNA-binding NarL/FixJ family response regulator
MTEADAAQSVTRIFLLDDHEIVRRGVADLLNSVPDFQVVGEAGTAGCPTAAASRCAGSSASSHRT